MTSEAVPHKTIVADERSIAAAIVASIRSAAIAAPESVVVLVEAGMPQPDRAMLIAAIAPLAIELAPITRLALIDIQIGAAPQNVAAVEEFLHAARSTTGQIVVVGA
ncbi:MAG: Rossmann fold domain-containing protein [Sphingomonas sp.]